MVGKRTFAPGAGTGKHNGGQQTTTHPQRGGHDDVESGLGGGPDVQGRPRLFRYRDDGDGAARDADDDRADGRREEELKHALLHGIDRDGLERFRKSSAELAAMGNGRVRAFYRAQNERLNDWLEVDAVVMALADDVLESMNPDPDHDGDQERVGALQRAQGNIGDLLPDEERARRRTAARRAAWAINVNVVANVLLLAGKGFAALTTGSLSLVASLVDSGLDLLCTLIVWSTNKVVLWRLAALRRRFPVGRRRLESLGILVFSIIMVISFLQILQESISRLVPPHGDAQSLGTGAISALVATVVVKGAIGLFCRPIRTPQVQALVQDCKTDVVFNTLSLLFPLVGYHADVWWLDPAGAGLLSLIIIYDWGRTSFENVVRLSGEAVDDDMLRKLVYMAYRFSPVVEGVKSITAYHAGDGVWAEFDLLLDGRTRLSRSHDIAETLQYCAEGLAGVDRAFVTTDYAAVGPTGHAQDTERNH